MAQQERILPAMQETLVQYLGQEDTPEEGMATHSRILPGESHGQRSPVGYCPWGRKESDVTEVTEHACTPVDLSRLEAYIILAFTGM